MLYYVAIGALDHTYYIPWLDNDIVFSPVDVSVSQISQKCCKRIGVKLSGIIGLGYGPFAEVLDMGQDVL